MISPKIEAARINYAKRNMELRKFKIYQPEELIKEAVEKHGDKLAVSCSFGSCSVVVLHMALKFKPNIKVVFCNTGVEYPETYAYRDLLKKEWNLNLIETKPIKSFWQCVKEYGFPLIRSRYGYAAKEREKRRGRKNSSLKPECCVYLKELPMKKACGEHGIEAALTGLRAAESGVRMFTIAQRGMFYHISKWGSLWRYHPIALWTHQQVWNYLKENNIPINQIYLKGKDRSGCMPCTGFLNWEKQLAKANPKMYRYIQKLRKVPLLDDYIQLENQVANRCVQTMLEEWF
jgi:phosphoadenosine phosphosulfate reductase